MRRPLIVGNWKMNTDASTAQRLAADVVAQAEQIGDVDLAVCPPSVYLATVADQVRGTRVGLGAQNIHHEASGAFTGEISAAMVLDVGAAYVILGHSERRTLMGESDADVNRKTHAATKAGLIPIVCVGEQLHEREAGATQSVIKKQFVGSFAQLSDAQMAELVIAYEPVWAIGTGRVATPEQAEEVHAELRKLVAAQYNPTIAERVRILYGGSVKPENAEELLSQPNVDGALVGGASLKANDFLAIAKGARAR